MIEISSQELFELISSKNPPLLIDVRQPEELIHGVLLNAHSFPLTDIPARIEELENLVKSQGGLQVVIYCRSGKRSEQVIKFLEQRGCNNLANLIGGTQDYSSLDDNISRY